MSQPAAASSSTLTATAAKPRVPTKPTSEPSAQVISYHIDPTEAPVDAAVANDAAADSLAPVAAADAGVLGCSHYVRKCLIRAPCCSTFYPCRLCHDEAARPPKLDHAIDRRAINEMVCMVCIRTGRGAGVQPVAQHCQDCGTSMAKYFCSVCNLFDDDESHSIFHCDGCQICRRGLKDDFFHCEICCCCYSRNLTTHQCRPGVTKQDCPICQSDMFSGREQISFLRCNHALHQSCLQAMFASTRSDNLVCPICRKSVVEENPELNRLIDEHIAARPMPEEHKDWTARILCNDCLEKSDGVVWRFDYHKCPHCSSYNTDVLERFTSLEQASQAKLKRTPSTTNNDTTSSSSGEAAASAASAASTESTSAAAAAAPTNENANNLPSIAAASSSSSSAPSAASDDANVEMQPAVAPSLPDSNSVATPASSSVNASSTDLQASAPQ